ncbi:hypothetical protein [Streptosporangium vulgare]|uniref:hypothetical protein n=1 Tax=Streptosporangium vulgare TaxID=46190 RepID=UPI0031D85828
MGDQLGPAVLPRAVSSWRRRSISTLVGSPYDTSGLRRAGRESARQVRESIWSAGGSPFAFWKAHTAARSAG